MSSRVGGTVRPAPHVPKRGLLGLLIVAGLVLGLGVVPASASNPPKPDPRQQRDQVRRQQAATAAKVDALKADQKDVAKALAVLDANANAEQAAVKSAQGEVDAADAAVKQAQTDRQATLDRMAALNKSAKRAAVAMYADSSQGLATLGLMGVTDATEALSRQTLASSINGDVQDINNQLNAARQDLEASERAASKAAAEAVAKRDALKQRLTDVTQARQQQADYAAAVSDRLEHALSEVDSLSSLDKQLSDQIAEQQRVLAEQLAKQARDAAAAAARRAAQLAAMPKAAPAGPAPTAMPSGPVSTVTVQGITVNQQIAKQVDALLTAAANDGIVLGGGGYRDQAAQIASRQRSCGTSYYDVYQKPSEQCRPPVAIPGSSMHQQGLAIDFTYNGSMIRSHSSPAFQWLAAHAADYGLYNYPAEPWHWSVNGH